MHPCSLLMEMHGWPELESMYNIVVQQPRDAPPSKHAQDITQLPNAIVCQLRLSVRPECHVGTAIHMAHRSISVPSSAPSPARSAIEGSNFEIQRPLLNLRWIGCGFCANVLRCGLVCLTCLSNQVLRNGNKFICNANPWLDGCPPRSCPAE